MTTEWLTEHEFAINDSNFIWILDEESSLTLWFEEAVRIDPEENQNTPVNNVEFNQLTFDGHNITTEGNIRIYSINGIMLAEGKNTISTAELNAGIYIITVKNDNKSFSTKVLVR
jgi:hypothetical protein